ncbi:tRNA threonylcarbamoyladenosine dehydratase [Comamonas odontotermitis]|uniref:tRNA threonylcarbamoyladenosine dehydratase n=1 Tax=Comamonas odontotermitis TaxID=379895 RepID=UPI001CC58236|nr:tRNA threonylcarbamoyladenosine dehydratase [Comamonas odontotermitis]UBB15487.1 tRNA threonylcarbamoyladenosine dehydratase [Comamonas odontotermitis]
MSDLSPAASDRQDAEMDADLQRRFGGLDRLLGVAPAANMRAACIAVVGIGGVGSWTAEALARSGVSRLRLIDLDNVAESNINRQIHALSSTIGMAKVDAMRERIAQINPHCQVDLVEDFLTPENCATLLDGVNGFVDACDQVRAKVAMAAWGLCHKRAFVCIGAAGGKRHAWKVEQEDLAHTTHDPLLAQVRYRLRKEYGAPKDGKKMNVPCIFSKEAVAGPDPSCAVDGDGSLNCHGYGSSVAVTATFGMCAAGWIMEKLAFSKK